MFAVLKTYRKLNPQGIVSRNWGHYNSHVCSFEWPRRGQHMTLPGRKQYWNHTRNRIISINQWCTEFVLADIRLFTTISQHTIILYDQVKQWITASAGVVLTWFCKRTTVSAPEGSTVKTMHHCCCRRATRSRVISLAILKHIDQHKRNSKSFNNRRNFVSDSINVVSILHADSIVLFVGLIIEGHLMTTFCNFTFVTSYTSTYNPLSSDQISNSMV